MKLYCHVGHIGFLLTSLAPFSKSLPWDTLGGWGNSTTEEVKKMGGALARHTRGEEAEVIRHLIQRVSVTLMKVNSNLILNRSPNLNHPSMDGIE